jgi:hypothetical protein
MVTFAICLPLLNGGGGGGNSRLHLLTFRSCTRPSSTGVVGGSQENNFHLSPHKPDAARLVTS